MFITGGTGFLGRSLLDYLLEVATRRGDDFRVTVLSRDPQRFVDRHAKYGRHPWLDFVAGDLMNLPRSTERYTDLIHAAADTHRVGGKIEWLEQLVEGTRQALDYGRDHGVERVLFTSSGAVYGRQPPDVAALSEDWPHAPLTTDVNSVYGNGKRMGEHLCALYAERYGMSCVIARCFAILSEHMPLDGPFAAGNFIRDALTRDRITVRGSGQAIRTYMDGRDMAHWLFTLLSAGTAGAAYNVGSDVPISVLDLAREIGSRLAPHKPVVIEARDEDASRSVYVPSIDKARTLGLSMETGLGESILAAADAVKALLRH